MQSYAMTLTLDGVVTLIIIFYFKPLSIVLNSYQDFLFNCLTNASIALVVRMALLLGNEWLATCGVLVSFIALCGASVLIFIPITPIYRTVS